MILWGSEHEGRAKALATAVHEQAADLDSLPRGSGGIQAIKNGDATLTIWGHGDETTLAELMDVELGALIQAWRALNPSLKTVELVTCNAQHNQNPLAGYATRVAKFVERKYKDIAVKALPKGQHPDDFSILWASERTATFCYLTAPSQATFDHANQRLGQLAGTQGSNLANTAASLAKERTLAAPNNFTVVGAGLDKLRPTLSVIKTS